MWKFKYVLTILEIMIENALLEKIRNLEPADRLELIGVVWDSLSSTDLHLTDDERELLDARLADMESNPNDQSPWADVKKRLEKLP